MKKVELIIESVYEHKLIELFKKYDISGYTIIKDIRSFLSKYGAKCILSDVMLLVGSPKK